MSWKIDEADVHITAHGMDASKMSLTHSTDVIEIIFVTPFYVRNINIYLDKYKSRTHHAIAHYDEQVTKKWSPRIPAE